MTFLRMQHRSRHRDYLPSSAIHLLDLGGIRHVVSLCTCPLLNNLSSPFFAFHILSGYPAGVRPELGRVQVVRYKGCRRCIPISAEVIIGCLERRSYIVCTEAFLASPSLK
jgi:hypothetical protein